MWSKNSSGHRTVPWGTPESLIQILLISLHSLQHTDLLTRDEWMNLANQLVVQTIVPASSRVTRPPLDTQPHLDRGMPLMNTKMYPFLKSHCFRAHSTWLDDLCMPGSTTLPWPRASVPRREPPWANTWWFSTGSEILSWSKNQSLFFCLVHTCLVFSWQPWLWHVSDKMSALLDTAKSITVNLITDFGKSTYCPISATSTKESCNNQIMPII